MKKFFLLFAALFLFAQSAAKAQLIEFSGGIVRDPLDLKGQKFQYEEMFFLTGIPIKLTGEVTYTVNADRGSQVYKVTAKSSDNTIQLKREVNLKQDSEKDATKGQTTMDTSVTKYTETIKIGTDTYAINSIQFGKSDIIDNRAVSDFYTGNIVMKKVFIINKDPLRKVTLELNGGNVGYNNFWGSTATQILQYHIVKEDKDQSWDGTVKIEASHGVNKKLQYEENINTGISFRGGYLQNISEEMVSVYTYDLPYFKDSVRDNIKRNKGSISLNEEKLPQIERLVVPKLRDIRGHWAEDAIGKLYSLDVFDDSNDIFAPDVFMTRRNFTKSVMKSVDIRVNSEQTKKPTSSRKKVEPSIFEDVEVTDVDYEYIKSAVSKNIIQGMDAKNFAPEQVLTRGQAITILIRALGFEHLAPNSEYDTGFSDDSDIPYWAKDSIYMAKEIGLIEGDNYNRVNANKKMTRAEASVMLIRFLEYLEADLQKEYRENIILY